MTSVDDLRAVRSHAASLVTMLDRLIGAPTSSPDAVDITGLQRTKAIEWVLDETGATMRPVEIWKILQDHDRTDPKMEVQVTTFDLAERKRIQRVGRGQYRAWQEDDDDTPGQMLLHEAMRTVLRDSRDRKMHPTDIASQIDERQLYRRADGRPLRAGQVRARATKYPHLFGRDGRQISLLPQDRVAAGS